MQIFEGVRILRTMFAVSAATVLSGCLITQQNPASDPQNDRIALGAKSELAVHRGNVIIRGPRGYCVDSTSLQRSGGSTLVVLASCEALRAQAGLAVAPALIVVQVLNDQHLEKPPTAASIAASIAPHKALRRVDGDDLALVHADAGPDGKLEGGGSKYWRGGMVINGHLISLSVYGKAGSDITEATGRKLIVALARELRRASPRKDDAGS